MHTQKHHTRGKQYQESTAGSSFHYFHFIIYTEQTAQLMNSGKKLERKVVQSHTVLQS